MEWFLVVALMTCSGANANGFCSPQEVRISMPSEEMCEKVKALNATYPSVECWARTQKLVEYHGTLSQKQDMFSHIPSMVTTDDGPATFDNRFNPMGFAR